MSDPTGSSFNVRRAIQDHAPKELAEKQKERADLVERLRVLTREIAELEVWTLIGGAA